MNTLEQGLIRDWKTTGAQPGCMICRHCGMELPATFAKALAHRDTSLGLTHMGIPISPCDAKRISSDGP